MLRTDECRDRAGVLNTVGSVAGEFKDKHPRKRQQHEGEPQENQGDLLASKAPHDRNCAQDGGAVQRKPVQLTASYASLGPEIADEASPSADFSCDGRERPGGVSRPPQTERLPHFPAALGAFSWA